MKTTKKKTQKRIRKNDIILTWDNEIEFKPTKYYIEAIKKLLIAEIKMMRIVHKESSECWYCGVANIKDTANSNHLSFTFGSKEDAKWIKRLGQVFVTVP